MAKVCAVPGCGKKLCHKNSTGLCITHRHLDGWCNCKWCGNGKPVGHQAANIERSPRYIATGEIIGCPTTVTDDDGDFAARFFGRLEMLTRRSDV